MRTLPLKIVNDLGTDSIGGSVVDLPFAWPGNETDIDVTDPPQIRSVWIGVSADGLTNQVYPPNTTPAQIIAGGWPRVYQGTELFGVDGSVVVVSQPIKTVEFLLASCCLTAIPTQAFTLKMSSSPLIIFWDGGPGYPCGTEAIFKLLAIKGTNETRTMKVMMRFGVYNNAGEVELEFYPLSPLDVNNLAVFTETIQAVRKWPDDFIGVPSSDGSVIVANDATPGPNEYRASFFDNGGMTLECSIVEDLGGDNHVFISGGTVDYALPNTDCDES